MKSLRGQLLVASPQLPDPNFYRSVVMVLDHDEDGAMGLILNRTCSRTLKDIWPLISNRPCLSNAPIGVGGPVEGPLLALHNNPLLDEFQVLPGVFFSQTRESIEQLVTDGKSSIRIFLGYAGWGGGQLEWEMDEGSWLVMPAADRHVFELDEDSLWQHAARTIGLQVAQTVTGARRVPEDPSVN